MKLERQEIEELIRHWTRKAEILVRKHDLMGVPKRADLDAAEECIIKAIDYHRMLEQIR